MPFSTCFSWFSGCETGFTAPVPVIWARGRFPVIFGIFRDFFRGFSRGFRRFRPPATRPCQTLARDVHFPSFVATHREALCGRKASPET